MTRKLVTGGIFFFCALIIFSACERERDPCLQPKIISMRVHTLKHVSDTTVTDSLLPNPIWIAIDSSIGIRYPKKTAFFSVLLSPLSDSCRYALQPDSAAAVFDTLTFFYDRRLQFLSNACGYTYFYGLHSVRTTRHFIDSVIIANRDVTSNVNTPEHVKVFF